MKNTVKITEYIDNKAVTSDKQLSFTKDNNTEMKSINIYPLVTYQPIEGFGGAATEATAYTWSLMDDNGKDELIEAYFGEKGSRYSCLRISLDSCDFSIGHYQAVTDKDDTEFKSFTLERDEKYVIPFIKAAQAKLGKKVDIILSPWSPPDFMKTTGERNNGGQLKPEYSNAWAEYICRYIKEYRQRGFNVTMLTIQNEPNAKQTWDSCLYDGAMEKVFLRDHLHPALKRNGIDIEVYIWDHNKERAYERAVEIIDDTTIEMITGLAFHWYTGEHFDTLRMIKERFPTLKLAFTEGCVEYNRFANNNQLQNARMYAHDIFGDLNNGMNRFFDWNLLLDEQGGPNHVSNFCDAPIMFDRGSKEIRCNLSYRYIWHFSHFLKEGAVRVATSKYTDDLDLTAYKNSDGSVVAVMMNKTDKPIPVSTRIEGQVCNDVLPGNAIATMVINL